MHRTQSDFYAFAIRMVQCNPSGFRDVRTSRKRANASDRTPTLMERLAIEDGHDDDWRPREPSARGTKRRKMQRLARQRMKEADRLRDLYRASHPSRRWAKAAPKGWRPKG